MNSGVYKITNIVTNEFYIGSSVQLSVRKNKHFAQLSRNTHNNKHLQNSFNKHSSSNFSFEILSTCPPEYCLKLEQWFIDNLKPIYNQLLIAGNSLGYKHSKESLQKLKQQDKTHCSKKLYQYDTNNNFVKEWISCSEYARNFNISRVAVIKAVKRNHKCQGYIVSYIPQHCDNLVDTPTHFVTYDLKSS